MNSQIIDTIKQYDTIIIHRHVRPDPDAYGSQLGLKYILEHNYPGKRVLAAGEHDVTMDFLGMPDRVEDADFKGSLVIVTDTANTERIDDQRFIGGEKIIKIDHHPNDDAYGDILFVDTKASSSSEMIYEIFAAGQQQEGWELPETAARQLYAGIIGDTGRFLFPSTTQKTFEIAGELIKSDFDRNALHNGMYEMERKLLHLQGYMYQNFKMDENGAAFVKITLDVLRDFEVTATETSLLVSSLGNVKGMKAWVIFIEEEDEIRVRLRSKGPVINGLAKEFNGGGHPMASGATAYSWEEAEQVIVRLKEICASAI
ncbi:MAG TPA: bifunctional oligoribonuclease/PAP phosphatase NrnA [Planococcus sp. (in: firmicutes)]|nr:bifunctional oligoribonuclease/PAP phosphatase NrnA [Planococcus sp. (in: firmicutes)]